MPTFFKDEGIFISGVLLLVALIAGSSYAAHTDQTNETAPQTPVADATTTVVSGLLRIVTSTPTILKTQTPAPTPTPAPASKPVREREYDDD